MRSRVPSLTVPAALSGGSGQGVKLFGQLYVAYVLPRVSVVANEPSEPGAALIRREGRQAQTSTEATTIDLTSYLDDQIVCTIKGVGDLSQRLLWVNELGITVSVINNARHTS
jgi:hypothetical protein